MCINFVVQSDPLIYYLESSNKFNEIIHFAWNYEPSKELKSQIMWFEIRKQISLPNSWAKLIVTEHSLYLLLLDSMLNLLSFPWKQKYFWNLTCSPTQRWKTHFSSQSVQFIEFQVESFQTILYSICNLKQVTHCILQCSHRTLRWIRKKSVKLRKIKFI